MNCSESESLIYIEEDFLRDGTIISYMKELYV